MEREMDQKWHSAYPLNVSIGIANDLVMKLMRPSKEVLMLQNMMRKMGALDMKVVPLMDTMNIHGFQVPPQPLFLHLFLQVFMFQGYFDVFWCLISQINTFD
jgi:hypothetical protein